MRILFWLSGLLAAGCLLITGCGINFEISPRTTPEPQVVKPPEPQEEILPEEPAVKPPAEEEATPTPAKPKEPDIPSGIPLGEEPVVETWERI